MLISVLVLFVFTCVISFVSYANVSEIEKVLKSKDYDYLSNNAKEFIKENYELSGNILLTEKNKEENKPYRLIIGGLNNCNKFLEYIYKDATVMLDRKFAKKEHLYDSLNIKDRILPL